MESIFGISSRVSLSMISRIYILYIHLWICEYAICRACHVHRDGLRSVPGYNLVFSHGGDVQNHSIYWKISLLTMGILRRERPFSCNNAAFVAFQQMLTLVWH